MYLCNWTHQRHWHGQSQTYNKNHASNHLFSLQITSAHRQTQKYTRRHRNTHADTCPTGEICISFRYTVRSDLKECFSFCLLCTTCKPFEISYLCVGLRVCVCVSVRLSDLSLHFWLCLIIACPHRMTKKYNSPWCM